MRFAASLIGAFLAIGCILAPRASAGKGSPKSHILRPYLQRGKGLAARRALRSGDPCKAASLLDTYLKRKQHDSYQAEFLGAYAHLKCGDQRAASRYFARLTSSYPLLSRYHQYFFAVSRYLAHDFEAAGKALADLSSDNTFPLKAEILLYRARIHSLLQEHQQAIPLWRDYLARYPDSGACAEALLRIGEQLYNDALGSPQRDEALTKAAETLRRILSEHPNSPFVSDANALLTKISADLDDNGQSVKLTPQEQYERGRRFFKVHQFRQAEKIFAAVVADVAEESAQLTLHCSALYYVAKSVMKQRRRQAAAEHFQAAIDVCMAAQNDIFTARSHYNLGRCLRAVDKAEDALGTFEKLVESFPHSTLADDALFQAADTAAELEDAEKARAYLRKAATEYPNADRRTDAQWRLAREALMQENWDGAASLLEADTNELRRMYWRARTLEEKGQSEEAAAAYTDCISRGPLAFYGLMAFVRLKELSSRAYGAAYRAHLLPTPRPTKTVSLPREARSIANETGVRRAAELALLGFPQFAFREVNQLRKATDESAYRTALWIIAFALDRSDQWNLAHDVGRRRDRSFRSEYPTKETVWRWQIAYPEAYEEVVRHQARRHHLPPSLLWAIMREESGFSPRIESWAKAIGLMQLLLPTAKALAKKERIRISAARLRDPDVNIRLGTRYIAGLLDVLDGNVAHTIASYNAGPFALQTWKDKFGDVELDLFIELIPYEETRRYTMRVLASYFSYQVLYERKKIPPMTITIRRAR